MTYASKQVLLHQRPAGLPSDDTWRIVTTDVPDPGQGEFVVRTDYISIDPAMRGWLNDVRSYVPPVAIDEVMRAGATGEVVASQHPGFAVGDHVYGAFGVTEHALSDGTGVKHIDLGVAAAPTWLGALGMPGLTAYFGLHEVGRIDAGDTVLISAAAGAVGSIAGQIAKAAGCTVIGIAGSDDKCAWLTDVGFDAAINYRTEDPLRRLREIAPTGVDVFFDNVGGDILDAGLANLARGAQVVLSGAVSTYNDEKLAPGPRRYMSLLVQRASMTGFVIFDYEDRFGEAVEQISGWIRDGKIVARETVATGGVEAFGATLLGLYRGVNTGKLVLQV
jgi:NADPH-dependent curcumin reductase CurA